MKKGWMIYPRYVGGHSDNAFGWLALEAAKQGISLSFLFLEDLSLVYGDGRYMISHAGKPCKEYPDFIIMRCYETALSTHFELLGIPVINSSASMSLSKDKVLTHQILADKGLPMPITVFSPAGEYDYRKLSGQFGSGRFVVKITDGAKGENVFLVGNETEMNDAVEKCGGKCLCQQFIEGSNGRDVRVWVIGGVAAAAVLRHSPSSFKSNFSLGGEVSDFVLTPEAAKLAVDAAGMLGLEFAGVDLLFGGSGLLVCEVNGNAGFRTLSKVRENNIPADLFSYIKRILTEN